MADFTAGSVLTAAQLDTAFNAYTIRDVSTTSATLGAADAGSMVNVNNNSGGTVTIPLNATWAAETGTHSVIFNGGTAGTWTIAITGGGTLNGSDLTVGIGEATKVFKTATNTWWAVPFSSGSAPATVTGTTGSPTTDTSSIPGKTVYTFTGSGFLTTGTAGTCRVLVVGGAGGAGGYGGGTNNSGGGGGGGHLYAATMYLDAGTTYTVTVGGGGPGGSGAADGTIGNQSRFGALVAGPGGYGGYAGGGPGASGGGAGRQGGGSKTGGAANYGDVQGFDGGDSNSSAYAAGGGGAGGAGTDNPGATNGAGGPGLANSITGSSVTRAAGGMGARAAGSLAGSANTGDGGASGDGVAAGGAGGSGVVIIVIG